MPATPAAYFVYPTDFGPIAIGATDGKVREIALGEAVLSGVRRPTAVANECATQIMEYLAGKRTAFTVPFEPQGTPFQQEVWRAIGNIPYGQTRTARDIAATLGTPQSFRLVGSALRRCPTPLLVPVHRVVTAAGKPSGTGKAAATNAALLALERREYR